MHCFFASALGLGWATSLVLTEPWGIALGTAKLLVALLVFWLPGYAWARFLHPGLTRNGTALALLGWAWSMAVFAAVALPFLWLGLRVSDFLLTLACVWAAWGLIAAVVWFRRGRVEPVPPASAPLPAPAQTADALPPGAGPVLARVPIYLVVCGIIAWVPHLAKLVNWRWIPLHGALYVVTLLIMVTMGWHLGQRLSQTLHDWLDFDARDDQPPEPALHWLAIGFLLLTIVSAMVFIRGDPDDCYYLAAVLDYATTDQLHAQEPTHREGLPVPVINRPIVYELWQAVLVRLTGVNPMLLARGLLLPLLIGLAYLAYANLLSEIVPRRWLPYALLALGAYHVWGISSHDTPSNYLLTRIWQGKAVLLHLVLPLLGWSTLQLAKQATDPRRWLSLLAVAVCGLGFSTSAIFLEPMLLTILPAAIVVCSRDRTRWWTIPAGLLAALPAVCLGLLMRSQVTQDPAISASSFFGWSSWSWARGFYFFYWYIQLGSAELMWLFLLPLLGFLLRPRSRLAYPVVFPLLFLLTFANPFLTDVVATYLSSYWTYFRVLWLLPVAVGLAASFALLVRLLSRGLVAWPGFAENPRIQRLLPIALTIAGLVATMFLPTLYVWSGDNIAMLGVLLPEAASHPVADNLAKVPAELIHIAEQLLADPEIDEVRILAPDMVTSYFTPYSPRFRYVQTRMLYTMYLFDKAGRREEGWKRFLLSLILEGHLPQAEGEPPKEYLNPYYTLPPYPNPRRTLDRKVITAWLDEFHVRYAVTPHWDLKKAQPKLEQTGFRPVWQGKQYTLWRRDVSARHETDQRESGNP
jgi:hypothetical protein